MTDFLQASQNFMLFDCLISCSQKLGSIDIDICIVAKILWQNKWSKGAVI